MEQIIFEPRIYRYDTCKEFLETYKLTADDLIFTNEYIYEPFFGDLDVKAARIFQEKYGTGEPTDVMITDIMADVKKGNYKRIFAIGGGSILDIAKILAVASDATLDEMYDDMGALKKQVELHAIPTTCGTGSEVTNISVVNRTKINAKMGLVSPEMFPDTALLIPELLTTLPYGVFATSSIDALVHAVESSLSPKATEYTKLFGYKATEMILKGYQILADKGQDALPELLGDFLVASNFAGLAFGTAGAGAVHAMSYPFGGKYHVAHGESNYAIFNGVLQYYLTKKTDGEIDTLRENLAEILDCTKEESFNEMDSLLNKILPRKPLKEYGVTEQDLPEFAKNVVENQQRLMSNNFVELSEKDILNIFKSIY